MSSVFDRDVGDCRRPGRGGVVVPPWPVRVRDCTTIAAVDAPHMMSMVARARPIAVVDVDLVLQEVTDGVRVVLRESTVSGWLLRCSWLTGRIQLWRNRRSVVRLLRQVTGRRA